MKMISRLAVAASVAALLAAGAVAWAGQQYPDASDNSSIGSVVVKWVNSLGLAQPVSQANPLPVGGSDGGAISATATPANASHAAGTSIGGLFTIPIARAAGGSGILTSAFWSSSGGSTGQLVLRIWQKNPASTTCTDNTAFAGNATDDANLITPPFSLTPSAPSVTTGDAKTYASALNLTVDYKNADTTPSQNLYACAVTVATDTADQNNAVRLTLSGPQN